MEQLPIPSQGKKVLDKARRENEVRLNKIRIADRRGEEVRVEDLLLNPLMEPDNRIHSFEPIAFGEHETLSRQIYDARLCLEEAVVITLLYVSLGYCLPMAYRKNAADGTVSDWIEIPPAKLHIYEVYLNLDIEEGSIDLEEIGVVTSLSFEKQAFDEWFEEFSKDQKLFRQKLGGAQESIDWEDIERRIHDILTGPDGKRPDTKIAYDVEASLRQEEKTVPTERNLRKRIKFVKDNLL